MVGVLTPKMQEGDDNDINRVVYVPFTTMGDIKDTKYLDGIWMDYKGEPKAVEQALRKTLAAAHDYRPTDRRAVFVANIMEQLTQFRIISLGLQVLLLFIGALTLGIAGIGLMNIMLVSVQQRTREIGVEKALGARKRHILLQFLLGGAGDLRCWRRWRELRWLMRLRRSSARSRSTARWLRTRMPAISHLIISPHSVVIATP